MRSNRLLANTIGVTRKLEHKIHQQHIWGVEFSSSASYSSTRNVKIVTSLTM